MSDMDITTMGDAGKAMPVPRGQYSDTETYDYLDFVYSGDASYIAKKLTTGNPPAENNEYWQLYARGGTLTENSDVSNTTVTFKTAETRSNIFSRESLSIIAGKVSKMYSDLKAVAFSGKYTDLEGRVTVTNNDLANVPGTAWDAVRGAQIRKDLDKLNSDLQKIRIDVTPDEDQDVINPDFVRVYKQGKNIFITFEGYTRKYLLPNHEYKLGILNYEGILPRIMLPILTSNDSNDIHVGYFDISTTAHVVQFKTPDFSEKNINYVAGSHIVFL